MNHSTKSIALFLLSSLGLTACVSAKKYEKLESNYGNLEQDYQKIKNAYNQEQQTNQNNQVVIEKLKDQLKVTFVDQLLFDEGKFDLKPNAKLALAKIVPSLTNLQNTRIKVQGHTDTKPIGPGLLKQGIRNNLDLSLLRARTVANFLMEKGIYKNMISAHGYGEAEPITANDSIPNRAKNRRTEIILSAGNSR